MSKKAAPPGAHQADFFVLRTPLQPRETFGCWSGALASMSALAVGKESELASALAGDRALLTERLRDWVRNPVVREALAIASDSLAESIDTWLLDPTSPRGRTLEIPLVRYLTRMSTRATPFGIFSGVSLGKMGSVTDMALSPASAGRRHARADAGLLSAIAEQLAADRPLRARLGYRVNPSLYEHGGVLRFISRTRQKNATEHAVQTLPSTEYLRCVLAHARQSMSLTELAQRLCAAHREVEAQEAREFVEALADHQLILPELDPLATGADAVTELIDQLSAVPEAGEAVRRLGEARSALANLNRAPLGADPGTYRMAEQVLAPCVPAWAQSLDRLQVDLYKPARRLLLGQSVVAEILEGAHVLHRLQRVAQSPCGEFARQFEERYGDRQVPLLEALDEEVGLGFGRRGTALAYGNRLPWREAGGGAFEAGDAFGKREHWLLARLAETLQRGQSELRISPADLSQFPPEDVPALPDAFSVTATIDARTPEAVEAGEFRVQLTAATGPSGVRLLGRFCHLDPGLLEAVRAHVRAEEALRPDVVFAEIVNLPEPRHGNFAFRPLLREYEIPIAGRSGAAWDRQLPPSDLYVSVERGRIVLRSARLAREVVPRLSTAQNPARATPLHRFLFALQDQGSSGNFSWDWGALASAPFLPRVVCGRAVLSAAQWWLSVEEQRQLKGLATDGERLRACARLRTARGVPRRIRYNNALLVDLQNILSIQSMIAAFKDRPALLCECIPDFDSAPVRGPEGSYEHEIVVPFVRREAPQPPRARARAQSAPPDTLAKRSFLPGSEWLYARLYLAQSVADTWLTEALPELLARLRAGNLIDGWFFLRYGDPHWHLRLRFHGEAGLLGVRVLPALNAVCEDWFQQGSLWRVQLDTYERELDRYGGVEAIALAERLFEADSDAVLEQLATQSGLTESGRFHLALAGVDRLFEDFAVPLEQRLMLVRGWRDDFLARNRDAREFSIGAGEMFRAGRAELERLGVGCAVHMPRPEDDALARRSERLKPVVDALRHLECAGRSSQPVSRLLRSFAHMHVNRMLRAASAPEECLAYDMLGRLYDSRRARMHHGNERRAPE